MANKVMSEGKQAELLEMEAPRAEVEEIFRFDPSGVLIGTEFRPKFAATITTEVNPTE